jgi:hypothetical protein
MSAEPRGSGDGEVDGNEPEEVPGPKQQWKAPVEQWVRDMYAKRNKLQG